MNDAPTGKTLLKAESLTDWEALRALSDAEIHCRIENDPDAHATDEAFWKDADVVMPQPKQVITIRLDRDLLDWFRQQSGYQTLKIQNLKLKTCEYP